MHQDVLDAMRDALAAADPARFIKAHLKLDEQTLRADNFRFTLEVYRRIFVIGGGKAAGRMAEAIERILGKWITGGLVIVPDYQWLRRQIHGIQYRFASHPIPSRKGVEGVVAMLGVVQNVTRDDMVIVLLSGGGSALMPLPVEGVSLKDEASVTSLMLKSGARIEEINGVRKHLSQIKGGRLAERLYPATVLSLIISDVVGDKIDAIASGPTAPDPTTYRDAKNVLEEYDLWQRIPRRPRKVIADGIAGSIPETPKKESKAFERVHNIIVGTNQEARLAAASSMKEAGYRTQILPTQINGEARRVGRTFGSIANDIKNNPVPIPSPMALVAGGETTVTVHGKGRGGRNQELALAAAMKISGSDAVVIGSFATDGIEGDTDAAGALADGSTVKRGLRLGMDPRKYLENNDSYRYFSRLGDLIVTGPTETNVSDIMIVAVDSE